MATNSDLNKLVEGDIKLKDADQETRRLFLEKSQNLTLNSLSKGILEEQECGPNIENMIGSAQIPMGIAGPLKVNGEHANGEFYVPLATTEGALVASVSRGCKAILVSGGADTIILQSRQARSILLKAANTADIKRLIEWLPKNFALLKKTGEEGERFLDITDIKPYVVGTNIWLRLLADTKDAMGMNMLTIAGKKIGDRIEGKTGIEFISETGNMCVDKKPSSLNLIEGRGKKVLSSILIPEKVITSHLKTNSIALAEMNYRKNLLGSAASGSLGFNAHFANIIAALFIATGQDAAHVVDGSLGFTTVEKTEDGVQFSVTLSSLQVGTVGGGTSLPTQREALMILGVQGPGDPPGTNSQKLAEIAAAAVLAGEISLLAALCTKNLSSSHQRLNR